MVEAMVEAMGLEPTTPCLQIRPTRTVANTDGRLRQVGLHFWTIANGGGRLRVVHEWSIAALGSTVERVMKAPPNSAPTHGSVPCRRLAARFDPLESPAQRGWMGLSLPTGRQCCMGPAERRSRK